MADVVIGQDAEIRFMSSLHGLGLPLPLLPESGSFPFVERPELISSLVMSLSRVTRNNPLLIGEAGVGKTALVQGLAYRIGSGDVPLSLRGVRIYPLDIATLFAGTNQRGELEERLAGIIEFLAKKPDRILFIDEIHTLMVGGAHGQVALTDALKPALADGTIRVIGSTTIAEYREHIECDAAFARRFRVLMVSEPSPDEVATILEPIRDYFEQAHGVAISDAAIDQSIRLSGTYLSDRFQPDKTIDVLDEACARHVFQHGINDAFRAVLLQRVDIANERSGALDSGNLAVVSQMDHEVLPQWRTSLKPHRTGESALQVSTVANVVAEWSHIPSAIILRTDRERLDGLSERMKRRVIGQDVAVDRLVEHLSLQQVGLGRSEGPLGSFLLSGPTGVGKTSLAQALATEFFGESRQLLRFDMSEYRESHAVSKLIGSPPGYAGYADRGQLTEALRTHPFGVLLFDEADKAHPEIWNLLLQLLEDGHLTDSHGRTARVHGHVIMLTTNLDQDGICQFFRPEVLGRLDEQLHLVCPDRNALLRIAEKELEGLALRCRDEGLLVEWTEIQGLAIALVDSMASETDLPAPRSVVRFIYGRVGGFIADQVIHNANDSLTISPGCLQQIKE